jgi:Uma2 family endonuclease
MVTTQSPRTVLVGEIVATGVSQADYMDKYAESHHEWVEGVVIKMSPISIKHQDIVDFLRDLLRAFFSLRPDMGKVVADPFVMRLEGRNRQPDLQVILDDNRDNLHDTYMDGPADICIEVVSPGSVETDYGVKLAEYEAGGVREYWLVDATRRSCHFHRLTDDGLYHPVPLDADGNYRSPLLPGLVIHTPTLWQETLPDYGAVWTMVQEMLKAFPRK